MGRAEPSVFSFSPGTEVFYQGKSGVVIRPVDLDAVLIRVSGTDVPVGQNVLLAKLRDLSPSIRAVSKVNLPEKEGDPDVLTLPQDSLQEIERRMTIIRPLLDAETSTRMMVEDRAREFGLNPSTLYRWIRRYKDAGITTALLRPARRDKGVSRLSPEVIAIINAAVEEIFLTPQKKKVKKVIEEIRQRCRTAKLKIPHAMTIRRYLSGLPLKKVVAKRSGKKGEYRDFVPLRGEFPHADSPYSVIQIDHTKVDIILVDETHRRPIGRPWITLAIDVFSRMVAGMCVSLDPPGAISTGLCLAHAILPKDDWLARLGIEASWPCYGLMRTVHLDNAREFRGRMMEGACQKYSITLEFRPVKQPHFGGHIERLIGTFMQEVHNLPGTTFSNPKEKGIYDPEGKAAMTLGEFEKWLTTFITGVYHVRQHASLNMSPLEKYRQGILGDETHPGTGLPPKVIDEQILRLDFMPFVERTAQEYGVVVDGIHYYHEILNPWINARTPGKGRIKRKFLFRRDPRDISQIWFYDPELFRYYPIPYRNTARPPMSVWELREATKAAQESGREVNEDLIFDALEKMRRIEMEALQTSKKARRKREARNRSTILPSPPKTSMPAEAEPTGEAAPVWKPFDELESS